MKIELKSVIMLQLFLSRKRIIGETKKLNVSDEAPANDEGCEDCWVSMSAHVGEIWLQIGVLSHCGFWKKRGKDGPRKRKRWK